MSPDLERLIRLQQLDTAIADAKTRIETHPQRLADTEARLAGATARLEAAKQRLKANQELRREMEKKAAVFQGRLSKFKEQLFAVKTNREYQAMQIEIETAQRELGAVEEQMLEQMMAADTIAADVAAAESALDAVRREVEAAKRALDDELAEVKARFDRATEAKAALRAELDPRLAGLYSQVARIRKGVAICAATRDGLCSVCHVRLRPHVFQQVRHNDSILQCESCQRILYYVPPPPPVEGPVFRS